ncbi:hypothetical protein PAHAL_9G185400 [Panicum hallii]|uniref:Uncharacterized protein n=1 Tax=Panicum hallii TaxID=206008 RepID=A0A2S3IKN7_9POAL|nr:hypothetical protein PAHAL_9G185400 [Panicum hallii]
MPLLRPAPPAPAAAVTLPRRCLLTARSRLDSPSAPPPLACLRLRPAAPLRGIPPRTGCRAAAANADADADAAPSQGPGGDGGARGALVRLGEALSLGFPVWVASACAIALWRPPAFLWVGPTAQMLGISFTMLGMGMTLTLDDLKTALLMPRELAAGFILQYTVMPLSGFLVSKLLKLPAHYAAGLILVSCCPGGTASNIVTYLARANVALSVLMTATSTFAAAFMTPLLTSKLAGQYVAVDPMGLFVSTSQNSVLGVVLATKHFGNPLTAVPCAVSSICHSVYGSIVAGIWRSMPPTDKGE